MALCSFYSSITIVFINDHKQRMHGESYAGDDGDDVCGQRCGENVWTYFDAFFRIGRT